MLAPNVAHLDPQSAVFEAMLEGWARQQRSRFLNERDTIGPRLRAVRRLAVFSGLYPWQWSPAEGEALGCAHTGRRDSTERRSLQVDFFRPQSRIPLRSKDGPSGPLFLFGNPLYRPSHWAMRTAARVPGLASPR